MGILSIFGFLIDPTNSYSSSLHLSFSQGFTRLVTTIVSAVTPISFVIIGSLLILTLCQTLTSSWILWILGFIAVSEVTWYFYCRHLHKDFNVPTSFAKPGLTSGARSQLLAKILEHLHNPWESLGRWFYKHEASSVGQECLLEWIAWAFFSKDRSELGPEEEEELQELVSSVVEKFPDKPKEPRGRGKVEFMRLHFDPIVVQHKPLVAYLVISLMQFVGGLYMTNVLKFRHCSLPGKDTSTKSTLSYYIYEPKAATTSAKPIFIVHGIGIGVTMYINMIKSVVTESGGRRPIVFLNLPHISLNVVSTVPSVEETLACIDTIFRRHSLGPCSWVAHSYGTIVSTWALKQRPEYISKLTFVDPVCFALWEPDLIYNFLYRTPSAPIHRIAQYFVAQDLLVAYTLFRRFWWLQNLLLPEELGVELDVFLSSHDFIIDARKTGRYLRGRVEKMEEQGTGRRLGVKEMHGLSHGSFLNSAKWTRDIVNCL